MLSEELRRRIEELNRLPLPTRRTDFAAVPSPHFLFGDGSLSQLLPGDECENESGKHYWVRQAVETFWPQGVNLRCDPATRQHSHEVHQELAAFVEHFPRSTMFLDLETCGFAGSMVFLIGLIWHDGDDWVLDQLLARDYSEERSILETLWHVSQGSQVLVTFNGKSFDWPMVLDRSIRHRLPCAITRTPAFHCDLLHHARREWKHLLPNCKLQTLEQAVCKRTRHDDISGAEIPVAYHQFVRSGNARELRSILHHNAMDLVTLVEVTVRLAGFRQNKEPAITIS